MEQQVRKNPLADIPVETVSEALDKGVASLDPQRAKALLGLAKVRTVRGAGDVREQKRLARKYGADSARVNTLATRLSLNDGLRRDLQSQAASASIKVPAVDPNRYVFYGLVRNGAGEAVPNLTIALYDEREEWIRAMGYGCTDADGYFKMDSENKTDFEVPAEKVADAKDNVISKTAGPDSRFAAHIYVLDEKQSILQIEKDPVYPQVGRVDSRIIILYSQTPLCTAPPPAARSKPSSGCLS